jgi:hypothetical protein
LNYHVDPNFLSANHDYGCDHGYDGHDHDDRDVHGHGDHGAHDYDLLLNFFLHAILQSFQVGKFHCLLDIIQSIPH